MLIFILNPTTCLETCKTIQMGGVGRRGGELNTLECTFKVTTKELIFLRFFQYANILHKVPLGLLFVLVSLLNNL